MNKYILYQGLQKGSDEIVKTFYNFSNVDFTKGWQKENIERAKQSQWQESPRYLTHKQFSEYFENGARYPYERAYFEKRKLLLTRAMLLASNNNCLEYKEALEEIIWDICSENYWCLPAHFMAIGDKDVSYDQYSTQLDLFSCETAFALAETITIHEKLLSPLILQCAKENIYKRVLTPYIQKDALYRFETMANNWSSVCGSAIGCAAILLEKNIHTLTNILYSVSSLMDVYLDSFGDDGLCVEGVGYWEYGFGFFIVYADLLKRRTADTINYFELEKVKKIALTINDFYISGNYTISFSDGRRTENFRRGLFSYVDSLYGSISFPPEKYAKDILSDHCYRFCLALRDILWGAENSVQCPKESTYFSDSNWLISRKERIIFATKAGTNGESHNHNDIGGYIVYIDGIPVVDDIGAAVYNKETFTEKRYAQFAPSSYSHSVATFNGEGQKAGCHYYGTMLEYNFSQHDSCSIQASTAYDGVENYTRTFVNDGVSLTVKNTYSLKTKCEISERIMSFGEIRIKKDAAIITSCGKQFEVKVLTDNVSLEAHTQQYVDHHSKEVPIHYITITSNEKQTSFEIQYSIKALD